MTPARNNIAKGGFAGHAAVLGGKSFSGAILGHPRRVPGHVRSFPAKTVSATANATCRMKYATDRIAVFCTAAITLTAAFTALANEGGNNLFTETSQAEEFMKKKADIPFPPPKKPKFTFIDLFAGIGGFHLAMHELGGKCVFASAWDKEAQATYKANYGKNMREAA